MTAPQTAADDSRRRLLVLVAGGMAMGVLLFLASRILVGAGAGDDLADADNLNTAPATPSAPAPATATAPGTGGTVETFEVFTTKNPFVPLRTAAVTGAAAAPTGQAAAAAGPAAAPAPVAATTEAGAAAPTSTGASTAAGGQATEPGRSTRVALLDVFAEDSRTVANVRVNDVVSKVGAGDTFASSFKVVSLDPGERCGRFLYGDDQFRMCKGEEILK